MAKMQRIKDTASQGCSPLRVWKRRGRVRGNHLVDSRIRVKCGCCDEAVEIHFSEEPARDQSCDTLEINGVIGTIDQWKQVFLPLLGLDDSK